MAMRAGLTAIYMDPVFAAAWTEDARQLEPAADAVVFKRGSSTLVFSARFGAGALDVVVKRRGLAGWRRRLAAFGRPSRAERSRRLAVRMIAAGLRVPTPRATFEVRRWGVLVESTLISDRIPDAEPLSAILARTSPGEPARRVVASAVGHAIGGLFATGFRNRDLKAPNLVADARAIWIVDLDGVREDDAARRKGPAAREGRRRDLMRLARDVRAARPPTATELRAFWGSYRRAVQATRGA